ncbi:MAG: AarF/ABC1/UbiB kinase family protein, partial [Pseudomonadota bacterium]
MQKKQPASSINPKTSEVPKGRLSRLGKLGGLAAKIAGNAIVTTAEQLAKAQKPTVNTTLFTQSNALTITEKLAQMRGAAMKVGQLLSMDAGEFLPAEWEPILAQLRQGGDAMPKEQLLLMLNEHWGSNWMQQFSYFSFEPIASASIGQVHKATLKSGKHLAVKVQFPGVAESIDSDIDNLGRLLKLSGVAPKELKLDSLLIEAKVQLKREADYRQEVSFMQAYAQHIEEDNRFIIPEPHLPLCNQYILAMSFIDGIPLDELVNQKQSTIDNVCFALMELTLNELFVSGLMQ